MTWCIRCNTLALINLTVPIKETKNNNYWHGRCYSEVIAVNKTWFVIISRLFLTFELCDKDWRNYIKSVCLSCLYAANCFVGCGKSHNFSWLHSGKLLLLFLETGSVTLSFISSCWMLLIYVNKMCRCDLCLTTPKVTAWCFIVLSWLHNKCSRFFLLNVNRITSYFHTQLQMFFMFQFKCSVVPPCLP